MKARRSATCLASSLAVVGALIAVPARAEEPRVRATGFAEAYYNFNFRQPGNAINHLRYFDPRHDQIALNNVGFTLEGEVGRVSGRTTLMFGGILDAFPTTGTPEIDLLWRPLAEANIAWKIPFSGGERHVAIEGGLFVTPFGPENFAVHDNWNWSHSNIFAILPFQLTGARAGVRLSRSVTVRGGIYSGWDQVLQDRNGFRTVMASLEFDAGDRGYFGVSYLGGVERAPTDREGPWFRHTVDAFGEYQVNARLAVRAHFFGGVEPNRLGTAAWVAGALYGRFKILPWMAVAARADVVHEWVPARGTSIFLLPYVRGVSTFGSATLTLDVRPHHNLALLVEYRHDHADGPFYYAGAVRGSRDASTGRVIYVLNATWQDTITVGATAWF